MDCRPGLAFLLWLLQVGPAPQINFTALVFPVHLAFDAYAFFSRDMFELTPAARRAGERAAIDDLGTAVIIVDDEDRIVNLNDEGEHVLDAEKRRFSAARSRSSSELSIRVAPTTQSR